MDFVQQMKIVANIQVSQLVEAMRSSGVLGAGRVAKAAEVLADLLKDPDYTVFLSLAGPVVPGGLRSVVAELIKRRAVDAVVSNGANITHDLVEALGFRHVKGNLAADDVKLGEEGIGRIGDVYVEQQAFQALEKESYRLLDRLLQEKTERKLGVYEILEGLGRLLVDGDSLLAAASQTGVPVFSPGIYDSMLGLHLWTYGRSKGLTVDLAKDMDRMAELVFNSKKIGAVILGGGMPKHYVLGASMLKGGVDAALQITMDRPETGSLSGATLEEAISWRKAKPEGSLVTVTADFTIVFPLLVAYALSKLP